MVPTMSTIAVIGSGSWGAAISIAAARHGARVLLWGRNPETISTLRSTRTHLQLGEVQLPENNYLIRWVVSSAIRSREVLVIKRARI